MKTIIHMGLHKTGTKYFQNYVFPELHGIIYNSPLLTQYAVDYIKADDIDKDDVLDLFMEEKKRYRNQTVLISREIFSGDLFTAYKDWNLSVGLLYDLFPEAKILIFFRYQPDWLLSCYKESIFEHHYQTIGRFLASININNLDYSKLIKSLNIYFDNVSVFFFENFFSGKHAPSIMPNRSYSSLAVKLSLLRYKLFKRFVHRPITFFGPGSIPAGNESISCLDKEKYWSGFLRDNEEIRSANYPNMSGAERIRTELTWRYFIKHRFDKIIYFNKDLLGKHRSQLDIKFKEMNKKLKETFKNVPDKYVK